MRVHLLVNLLAGSGRAKKAFEKTERLLAANKIPYSVKVSNYAGEMVSMAQITSDLLIGRPDEPLVVIGGDGSLNQALNGVKQSKNPDQPICYLPSGTGNDFARGAKLSTEPARIVAALQTPRIQPTDCIKYENLKTGQTGYFVNNLGIGFDAYVVQKSNHSPLKKELGHLIYGVNVISALKHQQTFPVKVVENGHTHEFKDAFLLTTTNHPFFGGGVKILPQTNPFNRKIAVIVIQKPGVNLFIRAASHLVTDGQHVKYPFFHYYFADEVQVANGDHEFGQLDGEELGEHAFSFKFTISKFNLLV
ncbi:MAG: diacylglycerol kinase family lipid kinase [Lactobacillus sp.]|jgi:YegS/Rv2252/BmrU family lipid kinase|nr:diacylglycerol kinase family lipid kinase [Lactobacillus sp.]MCH3989960.1 diacylglycerol kinase family lipid kinase [Lactobacillus sp.]MCH4069325.1 diacylglycerol kinase family lipid kinase [Lactobacillus sp.]MCI1303687.1 diacylglycerol kinase family lipid kinase [Lactobacillus sp.]MCI1329804.1 diacylglycerol kinase family lipid kinase [Lactobacillus sp.]